MIEVGVARSHGARAGDDQHGDRFHQRLAQSPLRAPAVSQARKVISGDGDDGRHED
jgi:hypothetical protein